MNSRNRMLLEESNVFCVLPWVSVNIQPDGDVMPCCVVEKKLARLGNLHQKDLSDIWNSEEMCLLRRNMMNGEKSRPCERCYALEKSGCASVRQDMNRHFRNHLSVVDETEKNGVLRRFNVAYLDIRFSNICNLKCRYCKLTLSSAWHPDQVLMGGERNEPAVLMPTNSPDDLWRQIEALLPGIERIYFSGGEPLISPEVHRLLDQLLRNRASRVELLFSTNFSELTPNGTDLAELWRQFSYVTVSASLDAMGSRGEYIRKNQKWQQVVENRKRMLAVCPETAFLIAPTLTVMNMFHLPDFHSDWVRQNLIQPDDIYINVLFGPEIFSVQMFPNELKCQIAEKYEAYIAQLTRRYGPGRASDQFRGALNYMWAKDTSENLGGFRDFTRQLDRIRGESFENVFPELKILMEESPAGHFLR